MSLSWLQGCNHGRIGLVHNDPSIGIDGEGTILQLIHRLVVQVRAAVRDQLAIFSDDSDRRDWQIIRCTIEIPVVDLDVLSDCSTLGLELRKRLAIRVVLGDRWVHYIGNDQMHVTEEKLMKRNVGMA